MRNYVIFCLVTAVLLCGISSYGSAAILTSADVLAGRVNTADTRFNGSVDYSGGIGAAVHYLVTGGEEMGREAKVQLLRQVLSARENLADAAGSTHDESSKALVDALIMVDLLSGRDVLTDEERAGLRNSLYQVIERYLDPAVYAWDHEEWVLGLPAVRISTACILYAFNFAEGSEAERYLEHGIRILRHNLLNSVDDHGAWLPDSPGDAIEVVYDMIIAAKAMKNKGFQDFFANHRFRDLLLYHMHLLPPQQCPFVKGEYMLAGIGATDPSTSPGGISVLAAKELYAHYPNEASYLMWYWNQCGNPVGPLGVLFIDPSIPYMRPDVPAGIVGGGAAILRDRAYNLRESFIIADFGNTDGIPDRNRRSHADHGDFSFIWEGMPLIVHESAAGDRSSERLMNAAAWRHNTVIPYRSGNSPKVLQNPADYMTDMVPTVQDTSKAVADMYPDGIRQYLSTPLVDYVAGDVRLTDRDLPVSAHYRHMLFLKPDALLIWDQAESPYPLEWGLWMPAERVHQEGNVLQLFNDDGYELHVLFAGENELDVTVEDMPEEKAADWPLVMSARYGAGSVFLVTADLFRPEQPQPGMPGAGRMLLENILHYSGDPGFIGLLAGSTTHFDGLLDSINLSYETIQPGHFAAIGPARYGTVVIDDSLSAEQTATLNDHIPDLQKYIHDGGRIVWCVRSPRTLRPGTPAGTATLPVMIDPAGDILDLSMDTDLANDLAFAPEDSLWTCRNTITRESLVSWMVSGPDSTTRAVIPAAWSDVWKVHAAVHARVPVQAYAADAFGKPRRISVRQQAAKDFFTLLLPRKTGSPYKFNVSRSGPGFVEFADPASTWEVYTGRTTWTDANLSVRIARNGTAEELYAFDCTWVDLGADKIYCDKPVTIHYSASEDKGTINASETTLISFHMGDMRIHAGEVSFRGLKTEVDLDRTTFISTIEVSDHDGEPLAGVRIDADGRFVGKTGPGGRLPLRWYGNQPEVTVTHKGGQITRLLVPGTMSFGIEEAQYQE